MRSPVLLIAAALLLCAARGSAQYDKVDVFPNLSFNSPVGLYHAEDASDRIFVVEQGGTVQVFPNNPVQTTTATFLDLTDSIVSGGELGLLGLAFHPQFASNRYIYVDYTRDNPLRTVISRFQVSASNPDSVVRGSELVLLTIAQPYENHNGGQLAFGTDGYLYIGMGDGGSGGDPLNNGQNTSVLLGKILRINVDAASNGNNYAIPPSNPFAGNLSGKRQEIYAYGLRNPWRFSFDPAGGGTLWVGDVGQGTWEEIDTIRNGANLGWNLLEGSHCFNSCDTTGIDLPLFDYEHVSGRCSITGGFLYRGSALPALDGTYIYGDYCTGEIWSFNRLALGGPTNTFLFNTGVNISSFGLDQSGEIYVCGVYSGKVYKLVLTPPPAPVLDQPGSGATGVSLTPSLSWGPSLSATSYRLQVSTSPSFASTVVDDSTLTDTLLQVGPLVGSTTFSWRVRAKNGAGSGPYSGTRSFTTTVPAVPPSATFLVAPAPGAADQPTVLSLRWQTASGAATYEIQVGTDSLFASPLADDSLIADTVHQISGLSVSTLYYWHVRGKNAAGYGPYSSVRAFTTGSTYSAAYTVRKSWNMVSLPLAVPDPRMSVLFPTATSAAFTYDPSAGYLQKDSLVVGTGYWIKFSDSQQVALTGTPVQTDSVAVKAGWNMIGTVAARVPVAAIIQNPPGIVLSAFYGYDGGYFGADTLVPGGAYWVKVGTPGTLVLTSAGLMSAVHTGTATYYTFADGGGNCMFDPTPNDLLVGAMNATEYANSAICGACATVTGPKGTIDIRIVDRCAGCALGGIDLSPTAFALVGDIPLGHVPISWHLRPCAVAGPIAYHFKDGSNQWWTAVQVRNARNPIAQFEYMVSPGVYKSVTRTSYNYFLNASGMGPGPYTFRVTDIFGNVLIDTGIAPAADTTVPGTSQFP